MKIFKAMGRGVVVALRYLFPLALVFFLSVTLLAVTRGSLGYSDAGNESQSCPSALSLVFHHGSETTDTRQYIDESRVLNARDPSFFVDKDHASAINVYIAHAKWDNEIENSYIRDNVNPQLRVATIRLNRDICYLGIRNDPFYTLWIASFIVFLLSGIVFVKTRKRGMKNGVGLVYLVIGLLFLGIGIDGLYIHNQHDGITIKAIPFTTSSPQARPNFPPIFPQVLQPKEPAQTFQYTSAMKAIKNKNLAALTPYPGTEIKVEGQDAPTPITVDQVDWTVSPAQDKSFQDAIAKYEKDRHASRTGLPGYSQVVAVNRAVRGGRGPQDIKRANQSGTKELAGLSLVVFAGFIILHRRKISNAIKV